MHLSMFTCPVQLRQHNKQLQGMVRKYDETFRVHSHCTCAIPFIATTAIGNIRSHNIISMPNRNIRDLFTFSRTLLRASHTLTQTHTHTDKPHGDSATMIAP